MRRGNPVSGRIAVVVGNLEALRLGQRYVDDDLNRRWAPERLAALRSGSSGGHGASEDREQAALLETFREITRDAMGPFHFIDLHTSSAEGPPFLTVGDTLSNRRFVRGFPLPAILGLEEMVDGSLLEYLNDAGFVTIGIEAGQHDSPVSIDRMEAALWLVLARAGFVPPEAVPDPERFRAVLLDASRGLPAVIEVRHRHSIGENDGFRMKPGFTNFQRVSAGETLASDRDGPIRAPMSGRILLPLYQGKGNDGFFIAREVTRAWLGASAALRVLRLGSTLRFLPGVHRVGRDPERLRIDRRIARWGAHELVRLFGFRKLRTDRETIVVSRRRHDRTPPATPPAF
jgi:succinylglutamate desuccinylase